MEHERQRAIQRKLFEDQMRALEQQQAAELLSLPVDPNEVTSPNGLHNMALSAPTTPPRAPSVVNGIRPSPTAAGTRDAYYLHEHQMHATALSSAMNKADKRKSVTYAPSASVLHPIEGLSANSGSGLGSMSRAAGAKSMPASRRTSASAESLEVDDITGTLKSLALVDTVNGNGQHSVSHPQGILRAMNNRFSEEPGAIGESHQYGSHGGHAFNAGMMLDQQLDQEMHSVYFFPPILRLLILSQTR